MSASAFTSKVRANALGRTFKVQNNNTSVSTSPAYRGSAGCGAMSYSRLKYTKPCCPLQVVRLQETGGPPSIPEYFLYNGGSPSTTGGLILDGGTPFTTGDRKLSGGTPSMLYPPERTTIPFLPKHITGGTPSMTGSYELGGGNPFKTGWQKLSGGTP